MTTSSSFVGYPRRWHVRGQARISLPAQHGEPLGTRLSWLARPLRAVNNQHSHLDEEFVHMQSRLSVQAPQTSQTWETQRKANSHTKHHVFYDTESHPYNLQPQRRVHHEGFHAPDAAHSQSRDLASAVEFSYQYSSNIVNYRKEEEEGSLPRTLVHRVRVLDYPSPSLLARDIMFSLLNGGKFLLELPDEPAAVSSLMTALGRVAMQLRTLGLATALDPVYDPAALSGGTCQSTGATSHASGHAGSHQHNHHHGGSGSPSSSHDFAAPGLCSTRRCLDGISGVYILCARAVAIPPSVASAKDSAAPASYTVGTSIGQEVLPVGPSVGIHSLLPALLRAVLRDGLVTLRCCWFDEDLGADSWPEDDRAATLPGSGGGEGGDKADCEEHDGCDATNLWSSGSGSPGRSRSPDGTPVAPVANVVPHPAIAAGPAGSLVRVPCVLRAVFKLDRQLRGLDLGGLVVLPHTFARSCRDSRTQLLHLDIVIA